MVPDTAPETGDKGGDFLSRTPSPASRRGASGLSRSLSGLLGGLLVVGVLALAPLPWAMGAGEEEALLLLSPVDHIENEREDLSRVTSDLELHYGIVHNRSIRDSLDRIARSLTPFLLHPGFPVDILLLDDPKPGAFYLGGETVVLTRGLVFSGLVKNSDTMAGLVALLLSRHDLLTDRSLLVRPSLSEEIQSRNRSARNAAEILMRAGFHYSGVVEAVRVFDLLRSGPGWEETIRYLQTNKTTILSEAALFDNGVNLLLGDRPGAALPLLVSYVDSHPRSLEGRFWLGLAYYRDYARRLSLSRESLLFSIDPVPRSPSGPSAHRLWERDFAQEIWRGIALESPGYSPVWNGLGRIALMEGRLKTAVKFFGRAANLNPENPWYNADYALGLWMRDHKVLGLERWKRATAVAGYDPRLIYDQGILAWIGEDLPPDRFDLVKTLPGWTEASRLWGEETGTRRLRPLPSFLGRALPAPLLPGLPAERLRHLAGIPTVAPIQTRRYLVWDYRFKHYRISLRNGTIRLAEFFGKTRDKLPEFPDQSISKRPGKSEDFPVEVIPFARIAFLRYRTIHHQWVVQRVGTVLDRIVILSDRPDTPGPPPHPQVFVPGKGEKKG
ncbi:MAG: tetratricopeptide repeat protein [Leptospirillia bacterium]